MMHPVAFGIPLEAWCVAGVLWYVLGQYGERTWAWINVHPPDECDNLKSLLDRGLISPREAKARIFGLAPYVLPVNPPPCPPVTMDQWRRDVVAGLAPPHPNPGWMTAAEVRVLEKSEWLYL